MLALVVASVPVVSIVLYYIFRGPRHKMLPPGPEQKFFFGNMKDLDSERVHQSLDSMAQTYGPIVYLKLLQKDVIVLNTADVIKKAFEDHGNQALFNDKPTGFYGTYLCFGHKNVLLGKYSDVTFKMKDVMLKTLTSSMSDIQISKEANRLIDGFEASVGGDYDPRSTVEDTFCYIFSTLVCGEHSDGDTGLIMDFISSSNKMMNPGVEGLLKNVPLLRLLPFGVGSLYSDALDKRDRLLHKFVEEKKACFNRSNGSGLVSDCLRLQAETAKEDNWLDDDMIKGMVLDTIGGGVIALTNTLLGVILNALNHPDCKKKMHTEIDDVLRGRSPTPDDIIRMPYCHAVILETLRYGSVVPIVSHCCSTADTEFEGYTIPEGTILFGNIWSAHHDQCLWGDPWTFRPERFLDHQGRLLPVDSDLRKCLFPMGIGARYCVGKQFSYKRLFVFTVSLFQRFDIHPPEHQELLSDNPRMYNCGAVLQMDNFSCQMSRRKTR